MDIPGLSYLENAIDSELHDKIVAQIDKGTWESVYNAREVQQYGYIYNYQTRKLGAYTKIPKWLTVLADFLDLPKPENIIINKYEPGEGISDHIDNACFGPIIASLSLQSPINMVLKLNALVKEFKLDACSLLKLEGESRNRWTHGIPARKFDDKVRRQPRYSITFRTVL
jgi:alkylated DNA repair dioxygenase AlkB